MFVEEGRRMAWGTSGRRWCWSSPVCSFSDSDTSFTAATEG